MTIEISYLRQSNETGFECHNKLLKLLNTRTEYVQTQIDEKLIVPRLQLMDKFGNPRI